MVQEAQQYLDKHHYGPIVGQEQLHGGVTSTVLRLCFADGRSVVYKESDHSQPGMYMSEVDGLQALRLHGCPRVPDVLSAGEDHLMIEDLGVQSEPPPGYWEAFGRELAHLHNHLKPQFGYDRPNYLGTMLLANDWTDDGHAFFAETRMLCFLAKPKSQKVFSEADRRMVERLGAKLGELIPEQPACVTHGDLWNGNMLIAFGSRPGLIDPAVYFGWAEADLALLPSCPSIPAAFYDAYLEVHPLEAGWRERLEILSIRDPLCMISEYGDVYDCANRVRLIAAKYA